MFSHKQPRNNTDRKDIIKKANLLAARGQNEEAFHLFLACIRSYQDYDLPMRALAVAKTARNVLGITPRLQALLIRLYNSVGLCGEADKEIQTCLSYLGLDKISLFQKLSQEETLALFEAMDVWNINSMEPVFQQGRPCSDIFIIQSGKFEMQRDQQPLRIMHQGEIFGEIGFFYPYTRSAAVRAIERGSLIRLKESFLRQFCKTHPALPHALRTLYTELLLPQAGGDIQIEFDTMAHNVGIPIPRGTTLAALEGVMIVKLADDLAHVAEVTIPKGMAIPAFDGIMIVKYGMVEVDYDDQDLSKKKFVRPGTVLQFSGDYARAHTNVRLIRAKHKL